MIQQEKKIINKLGLHTKLKLLQPLVN